MTISSNLEHELHLTSHEIHSILNAHPRTKKELSPYLKRLNILIEKVREENQMFEKVQAEVAVNQKRGKCMHILTAGSAIANLLVMIVAILDFAQDQGEQINCISDLKDYQCLDNESERIAFCRKDMNIQWTKFIGSLVAGVALGVIQYFAAKKQKSDEERDKLLQGVYNAKQIKLLQDFLGSVITLLSSKNKSNFKSSLEQLKKIKDDSQSLLPYVGTPELITSFLIKELNDTDLNAKLKRLKPPRRRQLHRHGEGSARFTRILKEDFLKAWDSLSDETGVQLNYIKVGNRFVYPNGYSTNTETRFRGLENPKPRLSLETPPSSRHNSDTKDELPEGLAIDIPPDS